MKGIPSILLERFETLETASRVPFSSIQVSVTTRIRATVVLSGYKMEQINVGSTYLGAHNMNEYGTQRVTVKATMIS